MQRIESLDDLRAMPAMAVLRVDGHPVTYTVEGVWKEDLVHVSWRNGDIDNPAPDLDVTDPRFHETLLGHTEVVGQASYRPRGGVVAINGFLNTQEF